MSMNDNLEVRVNELTDVIRGLSDKPFVASGDLNNVLNNFMQRFEDTNEKELYKLANEVTETVTDALENKHKEIKDRLSLFENFISSVEKTVQNSKTETEITRILNDIEALHSKMNSQEIQTEGLIKSFDLMKNSSSSGQITKLCDEIVSISKSYDGIVEVLNNNFQEFLRKIEAAGSREEIQRLRYFIESIEGNQNVLVSAMNTVNNKQEEIKNLVKQSSSSYSTEKFDQIQTAFNQLNKLIIDTTTKADLEIIADKIAGVADLINDFKRTYEENSEDEIKNVFQGQLNNIISRLEGLKLENNSNVNEDIIRLYTSIAEFKDGIYSAVNTQLNDVIASMDVQFDKISNSMVNASIDNNEAVNNLTGEVQKTNSIVNEGLNDRIAELKKEIQKQSQENIITTVNSIKGELTALMEEISAALGNNNSIQNLIGAIEGLKSGLDIDSLIVQMDQIKAALDLAPIKEQLALLNKDETINLINQKIDKIAEFSNNGEILTKLEEMTSSNNLDNIYSALDTINSKIDFGGIENKIGEIKEFLQDENLNGGISDIKEKLAVVENINEELVSIKNLDYILSEIKNRIEENYRLYSEKNNQNIELQNDIKEALQTIYAKISEDGEKDNLKENLNNIKDKIDSVLNVMNSGDDNGEFYSALSSIGEKIQNLSDKMDAPVDNSSLENSLGLIQEEVRKISDRVNLPADNSDLENSLGVIQEEIRRISDKINAPVDNSNFEEALNIIKEKIYQISDRVNSSDDNTNLENCLGAIQEEIRRISDKVNTPVDNSNLENELGAVREEIYEILNKISSPVDNTNLENSLAAIKEETHEILDKVFQPVDNGKIEDGLSSLQEAANRIISRLESAEEREIIENSLNDIKEAVWNILEKVNAPADNSSLENSLDVIKEEIHQISDKVNLPVDNTNLENALSALNNNLSLAVQKVYDSFVESSSNSLNALSTLGDSVDTINSKLMESSIQSEDKITKILDFVNENFNLISAKIRPDEDVAKMNNIMETISSVRERLNILDSKLTESLGSIKTDCDGAISNMSESMETVSLSVQNRLESVGLNFETSLNEINEKLNIIGTKINKNNEAKINEVKEEIGLLGEVVNSFAQNTINEQISNLEQSLLASDLNNSNLVKEIIQQAQTDTLNSLSELKNSILEGFSKNSLNEEFTSGLSELETKLNEKLGSLETFIGGTSQEESEKLQDSVSNKLESLKNDVDESVKKFTAQANEAQNELFGELIKNQISEVQLDTINYLKQESEILTSFITEKTELQGKELVSKIQEIFEARENSEAGISLIKTVTENISEILNNSASIKSDIGQLKVNSDKISEELESLKSKIDLDRPLTDKINALADSFQTIKTEITSSIPTLNPVFEHTDEIRASILSEIEESENKIIKQLKEKFEEIKISLLSQIEENDGNKNTPEEMISLFDEKVQERFSILEGVVDSSIEKLDEKTIDCLNQTNENYKNALNERADFIVDRLKSEYENKLTDIQKLIDNKVYEIVSRNNEIIKDELKLRAESAIKDISKDFKEKISKIESVLVKNEDEDEEAEQTYTLADVESDMAKIRLGLEKSNKLSNFKEFASRLVELKNINLENAKIQRVMGADIMRFDGWLKNTTAKIDLLAAKIEKSEKIKMEDLKTRLIQSEKNQAMPQKLEEAIMTIYKKYRIQETKIEDMINKIDSLSQKQTDSFDVKEFIDLFYDNTQKTQSLAGRIDGIEDKMDLIQAKIDHIIASCIDE